MTVDNFLAVVAHYHNGPQRIGPPCVFILLQQDVATLPIKRQSSFVHLCDTGLAGGFTDQ